MSTDGTDSGNKTEEVKLNVIETLSVPVKVHVSTTPIEPIDPVPCYQEIERRYHKANTKIVNACTRMADGKAPLDVALYCPKATEAQWNVSRYFSGLNRKEPLAGKEAKNYRALLEKATVNVKALEQLADETRVKAKEKIANQITAASKEVDDQQLVVTTRTEEEAEANRKLKGLKTTVSSKESNIQVRNVTKENIAFATSSPRVTGLKAKKTKTKEELAELTSWQNVLDLEETFNNYSSELSAATLKKTEAEKLKASKQLVLKTLNDNETKRSDAYKKKKEIATKSIELLLASGAHFLSLVIPDFKSPLESIDQETQLYGVYEEGVLQIQTLQASIALKEQELHALVVELAKTANEELTLVTDPEDLASDPVRKQKVDNEREAIAKRLREPLVGVTVVKARSEISAFANLVEMIRTELNSRADQTISCLLLNLTHGQPISKIGPATSGSGAISLFDNTNTNLEPTSILNAGTHQIKIIAAANADFKKGEKEFTVVVAKDTPTIVWRDPVPILRNSTLTVDTLNAKLKSSFGVILPVAPTYDPPVGRAMPNVREETLKAKFAGNDNYLAAAEKSVTIQVVADETTLGTEAMLKGRALKEPTLQEHKDLLETWNTDNSPKGLKAQSKQVMTAIKEMTPDELIDYMDTFITTGDGAGGKYVPQGTGTNLNMIWYLQNGLQVRYKPFGKLRPPPLNQTAPMFSIEGKTRNVLENEPSRRGFEEDVAFKLTVGGEPGAYGPDQTIIPPGISTNPGSQSYKRYMDAACATTHLKCKPKLEQVITWDNPPDITEGDALGEASLTPQSQDPSALEFTDGTGGAITKETVLPAGKQQVLRVKGKETLKYLASTNFVEVKINVKKVQTLTWNPPKEISAGSPIGDGVLNAVRHDNAVLSYFLVDDNTDKPIDANTILPAGKSWKLKVLAAATDDYHAITVPVEATIDVNKLLQTVTWNPPTSDIEEGSELGTALLNATVSTGAQPDYYLDTEKIDASTVLPVGEHKIQAIANGTDIYETSDPAFVTLHVNAKKESK